MLVVAWVFRSSPLGNTKTPDIAQRAEHENEEGKAVRERSDDHDRCSDG